jgi:hypothetical protein
MLAASMITSPAALQEATKRFSSTLIFGTVVKKHNRIAIETNRENLCFGIDNMHT